MGPLPNESKDHGYNPTKREGFKGNSSSQKCLATVDGRHSADQLRLVAYTSQVVVFRIFKPSTIGDMLVPMRDKLSDVVCS